jgi:hypothetical protein
MFTRLPDYPQAKHLASALWRGVGQARGAALIVGAGVSTMAQTVSEHTPKPPLWRDLANSLKGQLYPTNPDSAPTDSLRLAQEYQSYFGQAALNELLREQIPDKSWFPSPTHKRLLQLPWADVLTTNYDTLLERAATEIIAPAYDLVKTATDLVHARQPRIIKLHGSIDDDSQLVLTEDDYRTYPSRNAAMVNLARQVFIENELCLLGFSGDDPNFLQWSGWVRDHLQGAHRKIYLVGVLRLSPSARRLLEERNIAPIDLTPLVNDLPKSEQHATATALLLEFLEQSKPAPPYVWNLNNQPFDPFVQADTQPERNRLAALDNLRRRTAQWHEERRQYPGWVVCPKEYRDTLKSSCHSAEQDMQRALNSLDVSEKASFISEFVWRCRTAFCRPSDEQMAHLEQFIHRKGSDPLTTAQIECALLILSTYRDAGKTDSFADLETLIQREGLTADQQSRLNYERGLLARDLMRLDDLQTLLESIDGEDPLWKLRRAALACDLHMWDYARQQWLLAANDIRRREQADRQSIWVRSRRAHIDFITVIDWESQRNVDFTESRVRSIQDRVSHCDPWEQIEDARKAIQDIYDARQRERDETRQLTFHPGTFRHHQIFSAVIGGEWELCWETQRWAEWAAIPNRFKDSSLPNFVAETSALAFEPSLPWVLRMVRGIHGTQETYLNRHFSRLTIAKLPKEVRDQAVSILLNACEFWRKRIAQESGEDAKYTNQEALGKVMSVLGRFVVTADAETAQKCLEFAFDVAENNRDIDWRQHEALGNLFEGAISALPLHDAALAFRCASIPLTSELSGKRILEHLWPEPSQWITRFEANQDMELSPAHTEKINHLLRAARSNDIERRQALTRLSVLLRQGLLSPEQKTAFGAALWSRCDQGSPPMPSEMPFRMNALRNLPVPADFDVDSLLCQRLFTAPKSPQPDDETMIKMITVATPSPPLRPTSSSATALLNSYLEPNPRLRAWLRGSRNDPPHLLELRRVWLGQVIARALVPAMETSQLTIDRLTKLLNLMDEINCASAVAALPYFAAANPNEVSRMLYRIQAAVLGNASNDVVGGAEAIRTWLSTEHLHKCLSVDQIAHLHELLFTALTVSARLPAFAVVATTHTVLAKSLDSGNADRLTKVTELLLKRTQPDQIQPGTDDEAYFSKVRAEVLRMASTLLNSGQVKGDALQAAVLDSRTDPLPEIRFALVN